MKGKIKVFHWFVGFGVILGFNLIYRQFQSPMDGFSPTALLFGNVVSGFIVVVFMHYILDRIRNFMGLELTAKKRTSILYTLLVFYGLYVLLRITGVYQNKKEIFVRQCVQAMELKAESEPHLNQYDLRAYCECVMKKTMKLEVKDTSWMGDIGSTRAKELYGQCLADSKKPRHFEGTSPVGAADTVDVLNLINQIQVKVTINEKSVFLIFDSGASDIILSNAFIDRLDSTSVTRTGKKSAYQLVDGSSLETEIVRVDMFKIGRFEFHDLEVSVAQNIPHSLLGKSLLDRFSEWTITSNNQLILKP